MNRLFVMFVWSQNGISGSALQVLCGHHDAVTCVTIVTELDMAVSGSKVHEFGALCVCTLCVLCCRVACTSLLPHIVVFDINLCIQFVWFVCEHRFCLSFPLCYVNFDPRMAIVGMLGLILSNVIRTLESTFLMRIMSVDVCRVKIYS